MGQTNPSNVIDKRPLFSWTFDDIDAGSAQKAYRILVSDNLYDIVNNKGNLWDTQMVYSSLSSNIRYNGADLMDNSKYYWKVLTWDNEYFRGPYCGEQEFVTGSLAKFSNSQGGKWLYKKPITIDNTGGTLDRHQVFITPADIGASTLIGQGKMQADYDDVRFTTENDEELFHWIEPVGTGARGFWVKIPLINTGNMTIYIHYGNPDAVSSSDARNTFTPYAHGSIEGPFIVYKNGYYYLFVSFGGTFGEDCDYNVRVGRSQQVTGPYVDRDGNYMLEGGGTQVLASDAQWECPGHNAVLLDDGGTDRMFMHAFPAGNYSTRDLHIRNLTWDGDNWPVAGSAISLQGSYANTADPVVVKQNGTYYVFYTGDRIGMKKSTDMINWTNIGSALDAIPGWVADELPEWADWVWAPDIFYLNGLYYLYYTCSIIGTNNSVIGVATNETLDSGDPGNYWQDRGMVLRSSPNNCTWNALDPNVVKDENEDYWMSFGSYWDGIKIMKLASDLLGAKQPLEWHSIARRCIYDAVYGFADGFDDGVWTDDWEQNNFLWTGLGTVEETGGVIRTNTGGYRDGVQTKYRYSNVEVNVRAVDTNVSSILVFHFSHNNTIEFIANDNINGEKNIWNIVDGNGTKIWSESGAQALPADLKVRRSGNSYEFYINGSLKTTQTITGHTGNANIGFYTYGNGNWGTWDNFVIRDYVSDEPGMAVGTEEGMSGPNTPGTLLCENLVSPTNIIDPRPEFSWTFDDTDGGHQTAYKILVAASSAILASNIGDVWDSGKRAGAASSATYTGPALDNSMTYYWKVMTWDNDGLDGNYCSEQVFGTGTLAKFSNPEGGAWSFRKSITIANTGGSLSNYQVYVSLVDIGTEGLISQGKMKSGYEDVRFTDVNDTELSYWIDANGFWVKMNTLNNGNNNIYIYYGNTQADAVSDGEATFEFYDDFEDGVWADKWMQNDFWGSRSLGTAGESGGVIQTNTGAGNRDGLQTLPTFGDIEVRIRAVDTNQNNILVFHFSDNNIIEIIPNDSGNNKKAIFKMNTVGWENGSVEVTGTEIWNETGMVEPADLKVRRVGTQYTLYINGQNKTTRIVGEHKGNARIGLYTYGNGNWGKWDNCIIRKYVSQEPEITGVGAEEVYEPQEPPNAPVNPKCENQTNPTGVTDNDPEFSWMFSDIAPSDTQSAYRVLVSTSLTNLEANIGGMWDSGYTYSSSSWTEYNGSSLNDYTTYYWKVRVWDNHDMASPYCANQEFVMGLRFPNTAPVISGQTAVQKTGTGEVIVTYDLADSEQSVADIGMEYYNGISMVVSTAVTGDYGAGVSTSSVRQAVWDAVAEFNGEYRTDIYMQIIADDLQGGTTSANTAAFTLDTRAPEVSTGVEFMPLPISGNGSFTLHAGWDEHSPGVPEFDYNLNGIGYVGFSIGTDGNDSTRTYNINPDGDDYFAAIKCSYTDDYGNNSVNESTVTVYVKPMVPMVPEVGGETSNTIDVIVTPNSGENGDIWYVIKATSASGGKQYVQENGALGEKMTWQSSMTWNSPVTVQGLNSETTYWFSNAAGNPNDATPSEVENSASGWSESAAGMTVKAPVNVPTELVKERVGRHEIKMLWQGGEGNDSFGIERSTGVSGFVEIAVVTATVYTDGKLRAGTTYWYRVYGYDGGRKSDMPSDVLVQATDAVEVIGTDDSAEMASGEITVKIATGMFSTEGYVDMRILEPNDPAVKQAYDNEDVLKGVIESIADIRAYDLYGTEMVEFGKEAEIRIGYDRDALAEDEIDEESLRLYVLDEDNDRWEKVPGEQEVDSGKRVVIAKVKHFSIYCLMGSETGKELEILDIMNYPNPFSEGTVFSFVLTKPAVVGIDVYTVSGRMVKRFEDVDCDAGYNEIPVGDTWKGNDETGSNLGSGIYLYKVTAISDDKSVSVIGKAVLLR